MTNGVVRNDTLLEHLLRDNISTERKVTYFQKHDLAKHHSDKSIQRKVP